MSLPRKLHHYPIMRNTAATILFFLIISPLFSQGLPVDRKTGKVIYDGEISLRGMSQDSIADKLLTWFSSEIRFRGHFGPVVEILDGKYIQSTVEFNIVRVVRAYVWWVKARLRIYYEPEMIRYELTDFYTYGTASMFMLYTTEPAECPLEENTRFDIYHFNGMNDYARNLDEQVQNLVDLMEDYMKSE